VRYRDALALQHALFEHSPDDHLLLLEHSHVFTLGVRADLANVLVAPEAVGAELVRADRGGDVTYHGPGQLVGYPIVALGTGRRDAHRYLRDLEAGLIAAAAAYGIAASRAAGLTGVWVGEAKLAAIGVRIGTGWITSHGFALNVARDTSGFDAIVPCGIRDRSVTSIARCLGRELPLKTSRGRRAPASPRRSATRLFGTAPS
jgi:lipoate-protein ligase B